MSNTPRGAPELVSGQATPETTVNEQIRRTEAGAARFPVADRVTAPPGICADGANYIVIATATGAFTGKEGQIATAVGTNAASGWYYRTLGTIDEGAVAYVQDEDQEYKWSGSAWAVYTGSGVGSTASTTEVLTGTDTAKAVTPDSLASVWEQGSDVASGGTVSLGEGGYFNITGTTTITDIDFATDKAGRKAWVKFAGALTLTNGANLILPTGANITTAAGDIALFVSEGSNVIRCLCYQRASGAPLVTGSGSGSITTSGYTQATGKILGRSTASTGAIEEITLGSSLTLSAGVLSATTGGGAAGWLEKKWWDFAVDGSASTIEADVTGASEVLIIGYLMTSTSSVQRAIQVSTDGGSTWYTTSGDYNEVAGAGTVASNTGFFPHTTATTAARSFTVNLLNVGTGRIPMVASMPTRSVTGQFIASSTAINRVRVFGSSAAGGTPTGSFNGGTFRVSIR